LKETVAVVVLERMITVHYKKIEKNIVERK